MFIRRSQNIILSAENKTRKLLNLVPNDESLTKFFNGLKPEQHLANLLFDEVKFKESMLFTGGHMMGRAKGEQSFVKFALVIKLVCHHLGKKACFGLFP